MMPENILKSFEKMILNWETMKNSKTEDASEDAERFEQSFYLWIDELKAWILSIDQPIKNIEQIKRHPLLQRILKELPDPLLLNLEIELENILDELDN